MTLDYKIKFINTKLGEFKKHAIYSIEDIKNRISTYKGEVKLSSIFVTGKEKIYDVFKPDLTNLEQILSNEKIKSILICFDDQDYILFRYYQQNHKLGIDQEGFMLTEFYSNGKAKLDEILACFKYQISSQTISK
ncbi:MAG: hypothetical protein ISS82_01280 [Nanoarchaeota archaeon]|nr:hypothetical protein [Nanoarchaeota archaeon]